ncbi:DNA-directed RNA polymerase III subunit RPC5 [Cylas formicarius]|uniref:DNA-directed RNA polymerase III subunit RPC5 n=1 Tax=Cylas formicarius TaxID=197179 RepID=UPI0029589688|nr:DNA-directed RNA polymerase III subunit RPC5 [Cylas formicarius]
MEEVNSSENGAADDPIVCEIPIIHSKRLENSLYLFQYPLERKHSPNERRIRKCLYKPTNREIMLEMQIDTDSPNFDSGRAELIAYEVDGDAKKKDSVVFENEIVDKIFLKSSSVVREPKNYAVAAYNGKEIHLTALTDVFQFRPVFPYLDRSIKRKRDVLNMSDDEDDDQGQSEDARQVTVRFKQTDSKGGNKPENVSFRTLEARRAEEAWRECEWRESDTTASEVARLKLIADNCDEVAGSELKNTDYMSLLVPENREETPLEPALPSHVMSLHALRALPVPEQCRLLLKDAQIMHFQQIMMLLAGVEGVTTDGLLKHLQKVAVLVKGNWVVKSEVLFPDNTFSATSGVPSELMCRARDYVLYLFTKQQYVERKKVSSVMKIPSEELKEIFAGVSKLRTHNKGWELSLPTDYDFLSKHPDLAQRQGLFWEHRYHQLEQYLNQQSRRRRKSKSASDSETGGKPRSGSISCSDNESGTESRRKSPAPKKGSER